MWGKMPIFNTNPLDNLITKYQQYGDLVYNRHVEMLVAQEKWLEMNKGWYNLMKWDFFPLYTMIWHF